MRSITQRPERFNRIFWRTSMAVYEGTERQPEKALRRRKMPRPKRRGPHRGDYFRRQSGRAQVGALRILVGSLGDEDISTDRYIEPSPSRRTSSTSYGPAPAICLPRRTFRRSASSWYSTSSYSFIITQVGQKTLARITTPACIGAPSCALRVARAVRASSSMAGAGTSTARTRTSLSIGTPACRSARSCRSRGQGGNCRAPSCSSTWIRMPRRSPKYLGAS